MDEDSIFAALASTPRRKILAYLSEASMTAGEIAERFDMTKPSLSKHLQVLENAGLVRSEKRGQFVHYSVADKNLAGRLFELVSTFCPVSRPLKRQGAAVAQRRAAKSTPEE